MCYGTLVAWANQLGRSEIAAILEEALKGEHATDDNVAAMATSKIDAKAEAVTV